MTIGRGGGPAGGPAARAPLGAPGRNGRGDGNAWAHAHCSPQTKKVRRIEGLLLECMGCRRMRPRGWFTRKGSDDKGMVRWESQCRECRKPAKAAAAATRRTRLLSRGTYRAAEVRALMVSQGGVCASCRRTLVDGYHVDHKIPIAKGGMNVVGNLQLLCPRCNLTKGAKL